MQIDSNEAMQQAIELSDLFAQPLFSSGRQQLGELAIEIGLAVFSRMILSDDPNIEKYAQNAKIELKNNNSYVVHKKQFQSFLKADNYSNLKALVDELGASQTLEQSIEFSGYYKDIAENWDGRVYDTPYLTTNDATRKFVSTVFNNPPSNFYETFLYAKAMKVVETAKNLKYAAEHPDAVDLAYMFVEPIFKQDVFDVGEKYIDIVLPTFSRLVKQTQSVVPPNTLKNILNNILNCNGESNHNSNFCEFLTSNNYEVLERFLQKQTNSAEFTRSRNADILQHVSIHWNGFSYFPPSRMNQEESKKFYTIVKVLESPHPQMYCEFLEYLLQKFATRVEQICSTAQKANSILLHDIAQGQFLSVDQIQQKILNRRTKEETAQIVQAVEVEKASVPSVKRPAPPLPPAIRFVKG